MAESYLYRPSEDITRSFKETSAGVGNIFSQIIKKKQEDYAIAENMFQNINALTEKLGQYGQTEIINSTKDLLAKAAGNIQKNGKLDYDSLGAIRSGISDIKNRKLAIEGATEAYKQKVQIALATKDDLTSLSSTLLDLEKPLFDTRNKSSQDIISQMDKAYEDNIDLNTVSTKIFAKAAPITDFETDYVAEDGSRRKVAGKVINGFVYDPVTKTYSEPEDVEVTMPDGTVKTKDFYDVLTDQMTASNPNVLKTFRSRLGGAGAFSSDKDIVKQYFGQYKALQAAPKDLEIESKVDIDRKKTALDSEVWKNANLEDEWKLKKRVAEASISASNATRAAALAKATQSGGGRLDPSKYGIVQDTDPKSKYYGAKSIDFGDKVKITLPQVGGVKKEEVGMTSFEVVGMRTLPNGKQQLYGYEQKLGIKDAMGNKFYGDRTKYIDLDKNMQASLSMGIKNLGKDKQENIETGLYLYDAIESNLARPSGGVAPQRKPSANEAIDLSAWKNMK